MTLDLVLAILHHLAVFAVVALLAAQLVLVRPGLGVDTVRRLARLDGAYGGLAMVVLAAGFSRAIWGLKGWEYYSTYWLFWVKVGAFVLVGLLSVVPTLRFRRWLSAAAGDHAYAVPAGEVATVRRWMHVEAAVLLLIPVIAAMLARNVGY